MTTPQLGDTASLFYKVVICSIYFRSGYQWPILNYMQQNDWNTSFCIKCTNAKKQNDNSK